MVTKLTDIYLWVEPLNTETTAFVAHHVTNYLPSSSFVLLAVDDIRLFHAYDHIVFDRLGDSLHYGTAYRR